MLSVLFFVSIHGSHRGTLLDRLLYEMVWVCYVLNQFPPVNASLVPNLLGLVYLFTCFLSTDRKTPSARRSSRTKLFLRKAQGLGAKFQAVALDGPVSQLCHSLAV